MANKLETIIQSALKTFTKRFKKPPEFSQTDLFELMALTEGLGVKDLSKLGGVWRNCELQEFFKENRTNLDYYSVYEDDSVTIGVFLLDRGAKLPIHDHPNMYGILKVLTGIFKITNYSMVDVDRSVIINDQSMFYTNPLKVQKHDEVLVSEKNACCWLTPRERNIHEVECVEGPGAFLDILSPPYEEGTSSHPRVCHFFEEIRREEDGAPQGNHLKLIQVPSPF